MIHWGDLPPQNVFDFIASSGQVFHSLVWIVTNKCTSWEGGCCKKYLLWMWNGICKYKCLSVCAALMEGELNPQCSKGAPGFHGTVDTTAAPELDRGVANWVLWDEGAEMLLSSAVQIWTRLVVWNGRLGSKYHILAERRNYIWGIYVGNSTLIS